MTYTDLFEQDFSFNLSEGIAEQNESVFGFILNNNLSSMDHMDDPLIKHYSVANHFLDYNMTLRRARTALRFKFFFAGLFKRKPKIKKPAAKKPKKAKSRKSKRV